MKLPSLIAILSFFSIVVGIVFKIGQSIVLGSEFLFSNSYADLLYTALFIFPILFSVFSLIIFVDLLFHRPFRAVLIGRKLLQEKKVRSNIESWNQAFQALVIICFAVGLVIAISINFVIGVDYFIVSVSILIATLFFIRAAQNYFGRDLTSNGNSEENQVELDGSELLRTFMEYIVKSPSGWLLVLMIVFAAGFFSIISQDLEKADTILIFKGGVASKEVNILSSNSNILAVSDGSYVSFISRAEVFEIKRLATPHLDDRLKRSG